MKCRVCGSLEGEGQCGECRALAREMSVNAEAMEALRYDELPRVALRISRRRSRYPWLVAAAAIVALAVSLPMVWRHPPEAPAETLTIKMLTPDPTVVIYWLADVKEEKR